MSASASAARPVAVVTGASSGIGEATSKALARAGYTVLLLARTRATLEEVAQEIQAKGGRAEVYPVDVTNAAAVRATCAAIRNTHGTPEVLFNNAGIGRWRSVLETEHQDALDMIAAPYLAAFYLTREFLPGMLERNSGHVLNITSPVGFFPVAGAAAYSAARWAVRGFHESLWAELRGTGVSATLVVPGKVKTAYFDNNPGSEERIPRIARLLGTLSPDQVAARVVKALRRRPKLVTMPFLLRVFMWMHRLMPGTVDWLSAASGWQRAGQKR